MSRVIFGSNGSITLSNTADNPVYVIGTVAAAGVALYAQGNAGATNSWSITNFGTIAGTDTFSSLGGIGLKLGTTGAPVATSFVYNAIGGTITGEETGVLGYGTVTIANSGYIAGLNGGAGITLKSGSGSRITNDGTIIGAFGGAVNMLGGDGHLTNNIQGYIRGNTAISSIGGTIVNDGTIVGAFAAVKIHTSAGTVINSGTLVSAERSFGIGVGVYLYAGGYIRNNASGQISGFNYGAGGGGVLIVSNAGTIRSKNLDPDPLGTISNGVRFAGTGGTLINETTGLIHASKIGVYAMPGAANLMVSNAGTIEATGTSGVGIRLSEGGTVTNSGTITGGSGTAVVFGGTGNNLLALKAGYKFGGGVVAAGTSNTLELLGTAANPVTVSYASFAASNFQTVLFGPNGGSTLRVANAGGTLGVTIAGFDQASEIIDLTGIGSNGTITNFDTVTDRVTLTGSAGNVTLQFNSIDGLSFTTASDGAGGTVLEVPCYCRGTLIRTETGEVPVEELAIGDKVVTLSGEARPIKWIGRRAYDGRFVAANRAVLPIRIAAGALADGVPARDLFVSPEHALYIDGELVPAGLLTNGATITQVERIERLEYFHIELAAHDVILAEGAPAETFVDCDNRGMFQNAGEFAALYPDDTPEPWEFCAPRVEPGSAELTAIRATLLERAAALGYALEIDPDLHLIVDGAIVRPDAIGACVYRFDIPAGSAAVSLASRNTVPAETTVASRDIRRLGVPVERIALHDAEMSIEVWHGHASLREGFHEDEASHRWTDGLARLPKSWLCPFGGAFTLELHLAPTGLGYRIASNPCYAAPLEQIPMDLVQPSQIVIPGLDPGISGVPHRWPGQARP